MASPVSPGTRRRVRHSTFNRWKLEDAKARLSEVVRLAATDGPQLLTIRGKEMAYLVAADEYRRLLPKPEGHQPLAEFLQGLGLSEAELDRLDLTREPDTGRDLAL
ncbi:MAG: type II toxin-antitoxin system prevent-host-death family antitoxin [Terracidiphilus sp.]|nr:type II toxin-antitoxin system prevent-host-death family antitoxin [Terracidiphilus sp.]